MSDRLFGLRTLLQIPYAVDRPVSVIPRQRSLDRTAVLCERTPHQRVIRTLGRMIEELLGEVCLCLRRLGDQQQTRCVFVNAMHETDIGIVDI